MTNGWYNITLDKFVKIRAIFNDKERVAEDRQVALAALVGDISEEKLLTMPLVQAQPYFDAVRGLDEAPKRSRLRKTYIVAGWDLRVTETKDISVAQWVDFQSYGRDMENRLADVLSVVLVPKGKTYNEGYDIAALKRDLLANMTVPDALAVCFFFQRKWLKSMRRTLNFLVGWTTLKGKKELKQKALKAQAEISAMLRSL